MIHEVSMFDLVILEDEIDQTPKVGTLADAISFGDSIRANRPTGSFIDVVVFSDRITVDPGCRFTALMSESLVFSDSTHWRTHIQTIGDQLHIVDWLERVTFHRLTDNLTFTDSMSGSAGKALLDTLAFVDSFSYKAVTVLAMSDTLTLSEGLSMYFNGDPWRPMVPIVPEAP